MRKPGALVALVDDTPPHVAQELADEREAQTLAILFSGYEWLERMFAQFRGEARTGIGDGNLEREAGRLTQADGGKYQPTDKSCSDGNASAVHFRTGIASVGQQIDHHLLEGPPVRLDWRQRWVEFLDQVATIIATRADSCHGIADRFVQVAWAGCQLAAAAELLHPVDQLGNPVDLAFDHGGKWPVTFRSSTCEQLAGSTDSRKRILDFMREDRRSAQFNAILVVPIISLLSDFGERHDTPPRVGWKRGTGEIYAAGALPRIDRYSACDNLSITILHALAQAIIVDIDHVKQSGLQEPDSTSTQKLFGRRIGFDNSILVIEQKDCEDQSGNLSGSVGRARPLLHAALR
jgi:hypothetical protein